MSDRRRALGRRLLTAAAVAVGLLSSAGVRAEQVRRALIVGNNLGEHASRSLRYAEQEATRLGDLLRRSGDFGNVRVLRGAERGDVERALKSVEKELGAARAAGKTTLFLFYYSGHGDNEALELGTSRLPLRDLRAYLEQLPADVRLAFVDACQSGALTGVKGGHRAPAYAMRLADPGSVRGLAIVTSSTANELSQESDELRGSYFSHNIMAGLQGLADASRDGQVTLSELYDFAFRRTLANTAANLVGGQHPTYDYRMSGTGDVVLSRTRPSDARLRFPREAGATYTVLSDDEVAAELVSSPSENLYLALPAGKYRVVRRALARLAERTVTLEAGEGITLEPSEMAPVLALADEGNRKKGDDLIERQSLGASVGMQTSVVTGSEAYLGTVGLAYGYDFDALTLRVRADLTSFMGGEPSYRARFLRVAPAIEMLFPLFEGTHLSLLLGPTAGVPIVRQQDDRGQTMTSYGVAYGGTAAFGLRLSQHAGLLLSVTGGGETFRMNGIVVNKPSAGMALAGLFAF